jgi:hypothetical protein
VRAPLAMLALLLADPAGSDFDRLAAIAGEWKAPAAKRPLAVAYRRVSAGTVLVETYGAGSGRETLRMHFRHFTSEALGSHRYLPWHPSGGARPWSELEALRARTWCT